MKNKILIDNWTLRILGPLVSGTVIYLLILLVNNNLDAIFDSFITNEFFISIGIALIILEGTRFISKKYERITNRFTTKLGITVYLLIVVGSASLIVIVSLFAYFNWILGYLPNISEIQPFLLLYISLSIAYATMFVSNYYLSKSLENKILEEKKLAIQTKERFNRLTKGMNPDLLFESLESLISIIYSNKVLAEDMIDDLSLVYRYTLSNQQKEIISLQDEIEPLEAFVRLLNKLPYRKVQLELQLDHTIHLIPNTLILVTEQVVKSTIINNSKDLNIKLRSDEKGMFLEYITHDRLVNGFNIEKIEKLQSSFMIYTDEKITIDDRPPSRTIWIPNLHLDTQDQ